MLKQYIKFLFSSLIFIVFSACKSNDNKERDTLLGQLETARQHISTGEFNKATYMLNNLRKVYPNSFEIEMLLGLACIGLKNYQVASDAFLKALYIDNKNSDARLNLALTYILQKKYKLATIELQKIENSSNYLYMEKIQLNYGLIEMEQKRCYNAYKYFDKAIRLDPTISQAYYNKGVCLLQENKIQEANFNFKKANDFCSNCIDPTVNLAYSYYLLGKKKQAIASLDQLLQNQLDTETEAKLRQLRNDYSR